MIDFDDVEVTGSLVVCDGELHVVYVAGGYALRWSTRGPDVATASTLGDALRAAAALVDELE
jgi:hypothetical protein